MLPLPKIVLSASDYPRLEQLARVAFQRGDMSAMFLMGEINRAEIIPGDARNIQSIVTIGSWITYWTNWDVPRKTVQQSGQRTARPTLPRYPCYRHWAQH